MVDRKKIENKLYWLERVLADIKHSEVPRLSYQEEKDIVREALIAYQSELTGKLY